LSDRLALDPALSLFRVFPPVFVNPTEWSSVLDQMQDMKTRVNLFGPHPSLLIDAHLASIPPLGVYMENLPHTG